MQGRGDDWEGKGAALTEQSRIHIQQGGDAEEVASAVRDALYTQHQTTHDFLRGLRRDRGKIAQSQLLGGLKTVLGDAWAGSKVCY